MNAFLYIKKYFLIIVKYFSLIFFSFVAVLPVVSCVITAFKPEKEYNSTNVMDMPSSWTYFENFKEAFVKANMGRGFINSTIILVCVLLISTIIGTQLAYVLDRFAFPGNKIIRSLSCLLLFFPA